MNIKIGDYIKRTFADDGRWYIFKILNKEAYGWYEAEVVASRDNDCLNSIGSYTFFGDSYSITEILLTDKDELMVELL